MAELRASGATFKEIADLYGVSAPAVWQSLSRAGFITASHRPAPKELDKKQLENLYAGERLPIKKIASVLEVSVLTIETALKFHRIQKRKSLKLNGKNVNVLETLKVGEYLEIQPSNKFHQQVLYKAAKTLGIKISLKTISSKRFKVTRVEETADKNLRQHQRIDKNQLEELYFAKRLPITQIAGVLGVSEEVLANALEYHKIPKRPPLKFGGRRVDVLRNLAVGEQTEISCELKYPVTNLHNIANRTGIKISVRSLGGGRFRVKRVKKVVENRIKKST